jgi:hypothetical protein
LSPSPRSPASSMWCPVSSKSIVKPHAYVVIESRRIAPQIEVPDGYRELPGIGTVVIDEAGNTESKIKSIVDGPIEDVLDLQYVATGWYEHDGTVNFTPGAVRLLNLIKIGVDAETIGSENIQRVLQGFMNLVDSTLEEYEVRDGGAIRAIMRSRITAMAKALQR